MNESTVDQTVDVVVTGHDEAARAAVRELRRRGAAVEHADDREVQVWAVTTVDGSLVVDLAVNGRPTDAIACRAVISALSAHGSAPLVPGGEHTREPGEPLDGDTLLVGGHPGALTEALRHGTPREVWLSFSRRELLRAGRLLAMLVRRRARVRFETVLAAVEADGPALRARPRGLTVRRVVVADTRVPPSELVRSAGMPAVWDPVLGGWVATAAPAPIVAAGAAAGVCGRAGLAAHGALIADVVAGSLGLGGGLSPPRRAALARTVRRGERLAHRQAGFASPAAHPAPDAVVCPCEGVTIADLDAVAALLPDAATPRDVKLLSRAGMGLCQGRRCAAAVTAWTRQHRTTADLDAGLRPRLPLTPLVLCAQPDPETDRSLE